MDDSTIAAAGDNPSVREDFTTTEDSYCRIRTRGWD